MWKSYWKDKRKNSISNFSKISRRIREKVLLWKRTRNSVNKKLLPPIGSFVVVIFWALKRVCDTAFACSTVSSYNIRYTDWEKTCPKGVLLKKKFCQFFDTKSVTIWRISSYTFPGPILMRECAGLVLAHPHGGRGPSMSKALPRFFLCILSRWIWISLFYIKVSTIVSFYIILRHDVSQNT